MKTEKEEYGEFIEYDYYLILGSKDHCDVFIKDSFESL